MERIPDDGLALLGMSYDNTGRLGADTWRHVAFIEQDKPLAGRPDTGGVHDRCPGSCRDPDRPGS